MYREILNGQREMTHKTEFPMKTICQKNLRDYTEIRKTRSHYQQCRQRVRESSGVGSSRRCVPTRSTRDNTLHTSLNEQCAQL